MATKDFAGVEIAYHSASGLTGNVKDFFNGGAMFNTLFALREKNKDLVVISFEGADPAEVQRARGAVAIELGRLNNPQHWDVREVVDYAEFVRLFERDQDGKIILPPGPQIDYAAEILPEGFFAGHSGAVDAVVEAPVMIINDAEIGRRIAEKEQVVPEDVEQEIQKLKMAVTSIADQFEKALILKGGSLEDGSAISRNHSMLRGLLQELKEIIREKKIGSAAAGRIIKERLDESESLAADQIALLNDILMTRYRLIGEILGQLSERPEARAIVIISTLTPIISLRFTEATNKKIAGVICEKRISKESHQIILLDNAAIPVLTGVKGITLKVSPGLKILLDTAEELVAVAKDTSEAQAYHRCRQLEQERIETLRAEYDPALTVTTKDGARQISLAINAERLSELETSRFAAIGLFRSEFFFMKNPDGSYRQKAPHFFELFDHYLAIFNLCKSRPVTLRTFDFTSTKFPQYFDLEMIKEACGNELGPEGYLIYRGEENELSRFEPLNHLFRKQVRAFLLAAGVAEQQGVEINPRLLFPMITSLAKFKLAQEIVGEEQARLRATNEPYYSNMPLLTMIETVPAARDAGLLAAEAQSLNIGTNDLNVALFPAVESRDAVEVVDPGRGELRPKLLKTVHRIAVQANDHHVPACVCGALASNARYVPLLIGAGVDSLSVTAYQAPVIDWLIRNITFHDAQMLFREASGLGTKEAIEDLLDRKYRDWFGMVESDGTTARWAHLKEISSLMMNRPAAAIIKLGNGLPIT